MDGANILISLKMLNLDICLSFADIGHNIRDSFKKGRMKIGYIVHDLNDPSVERRCIMLERGGAEVVLTGFYRGDKVKSVVAGRNPLVLGRTKDAAMLSRLTSTLKHVFSVGKLKAHFMDCDVILARNLEQLAIAMRLKVSRHLTYECLDLHRLLLGTGFVPRMIQSVESKLLSKVDGLLTSSPAFLRNHFDDSTLNAPQYLIENKFLVETVSECLPPSAATSSVIRIGWFGMLRCRKTFKVLRELAERSDGRVEVIISGRPSVAELPELPEVAKASKGVTYTGPYTYSDLPELYGQCHFAWAIDWFEEGLNSEWLLPNRLYESISHGAVPIVLAKTEMGRWLEARGAGLRIMPGTDPCEMILGLKPSDIAGFQAEIQAVPVGDVMADDTDCERLVKFISRAEII